ncbi:MAG: hypothetical protein ACTSRW_14360 [Candidatus Helarchaeota archaeon]
MPLLSEINWSYYAKYPFVASAREIIVEHNFTLFNILNDVPEVLENVEKNLDLILEDIDSFASKELGKGATEFLSYSVQNALVSFINDKWFIQRYAEAFAKRTRMSIKKEKDSKIIELIAELGAKIEPEDTEPTTWKMKVIDYLKYLSEIRIPLKDVKLKHNMEKKWKLVNRRVGDGYVRNLDGRELHQIFEEVLRKWITKRISRIIGEMEETDLPKLLIEKGLEFKAKINDFKKERKIGEYYTGNVYNEAFPGCINKLYNDILAGRNLSNDERLVIEFFLLSIGFKKDELLKLFAHSPDFKADKSEYFIEHALKKEYYSFGCKSLRTKGFCYISPSVDLYNWCSEGKIKNPVNFFRRMVWMLEKIIFPHFISILLQFFFYPFFPIRKAAPPLVKYLKMTRGKQKSKKTGK